MISPKTFRIIFYTTNMAWYCGAIPYRFVKQKNGVHLITTSFTRHRTHFVLTSFMLNVFYISFIVIRVFQKIVLENEVASVDFIVQMGYLFFCYSMPVVLQINTLLKWKEIPEFFIQYMSFFRSLKARYGLQGESGPRCIKFFSAVLVIGGLVNLQNMIIIAKKPDRLHFLTSVLADPKNKPLWLRLPLLFLQGWIWMSTWAHVWAFCFHFYAYIACMVWTLQELE